MHGYGIPCAFGFKWTPVSGTEAADVECKIWRRSAHRLPKAHSSIQALSQNLDQKLSCMRWHGPFIAAIEDGNEAIVRIQFGLMTQSP